MIAVRLEQRSHAQGPSRGRTDSHRDVADSVGEPGLFGFEDFATRGRQVTSHSERTERRGQTDFLGGLQ